MEDEDPPLFARVAQTSGHLDDHNHIETTTITEILVDFTLPDTEQTKEQKAKEMETNVENLAAKTLQAPCLSKYINSKLCQTIKVNDK